MLQVPKKRDNKAEEKSNVAKMINPKGKRGIPPKDEFNQPLIMTPAQAKKDYADACRSILRNMKRLLKEYKCV